MDNDEEDNNTIKSQEMDRQHNESIGRPFDLIIFAASSSVGKFLVEELALVVDKYYSPAASSSTTKQSDKSPPRTHLRDPNQFAQTGQRRRSVPRQVDGVRWAVAGRSAIKLSETLCRAEVSAGVKDLSLRIPVILADINHHKSLVEMCQKTQVVINCAGPYTELGEPLIQACLETGTSYVDLAHETTFIETIQQKYSDRAKDCKVFIINGCGFQSMSAEMGLNFTKQVADGQVDEIKIILNLSDTKAQARTLASTAGSFLGNLGGLNSSGGIVSPGMWRSLIVEKSQEISVDQRLQQSRTSPKTTRITTGQNLNGQTSSKASSSTNTTSSALETIKSIPKSILQRKDTQSLVKDIVQFRNRNIPSSSRIYNWLQMFQGVTQSNGRGYCYPMDGVTSDEAQLIRGEMCNYEYRRPDLASSRGWRPIRCTSFLSMRSLIELCFAFIWLMVFNLFVRLSPTRQLMKTFPMLISFGYVNSSGRDLDRDSLSHIKYCQTFIAYGTPNEDSGDPLEERDENQMRKQVQLLVSRIVGPEPNHVATATYAIQAALAVVLEREHLPGGCQSGGCLTPGSAFAETNIIYQLRRRNIKFEVLKKA